MSDVSRYVDISPSPSANAIPSSQSNLSSNPPTTGFGQVTGSGLGSSPNVQSLHKASGGEGLTRAQLAEKRAAEAKEQDKADGPGQTTQPAQG